MGLVRKVKKVVSSKRVVSSVDEVVWEDRDFSDLVDAKSAYPILNVLRMPKDPQPTTPQQNESYIFNLDTLHAAMLAWKLGEPIWVVGPSGCGKTEFFRQLASLLNLGFYRVNFDRRMTRGQVFGQDRIMVKGTPPVPYQKFVMGSITEAIQKPSILLLDEFDHADNQIRMAMQSLLEGDNLRLLDLGTKTIVRSKDCLIAATSNTWGMGDESGLYGHGGEMINFSTLNRFTFKLEVDYPPLSDELQALKTLHPKVTTEQKKMFEQLAKVAGLIRKAFKENTVGFPITTRDLFSWANKVLLIGDVYVAANMTFLAAFPERDKPIVLETIQRATAIDVPNEVAPAQEPSTEIG